MTRSPGRPPIGSRVSVRLPDELLDRVDAEAEQSGASRAATVRRLIEGGLGDTGVDLAQIRRALALTPAERIRTVARTERALSAIRGRALQ